MRQVYILFILLIVLIPVSAMGNTDATRWADIFNRVITSGGTPQGFDVNNVQLQSGDRELLGLNNDAKTFLQSRSTKPESHVKGLNADFANRLANFFRAAEGAGYGLKVYSGYRSIEHQDRLFKAAVIRYGSESAARRYVAPPGRSNHNFGKAVDLRFSSSNAKRWAHQNAERYGLWFRMAHEPWHIEPKGGVREDSQTASQQQRLNEITNTSNSNDQEEVGPLQQMLNNLTDADTPYNNESTPQEGYGSTGPQNNDQSQASPPTSGIGNNGRDINPADSMDTPGSIWDFFKKKDRATTLSCASDNINLGERVLIKWSCGDGSTSSRGGTTRKESRFNTKGRLSGGGYASPRESIRYKVQCLAGKKVVGEAICSIRVNNSSIKSGVETSDIDMALTATHKSVEWGTGTTLRWDVEGASKCTIKGGNVEESGTAGSVNTGRLFHSTIYALQCDLPSGSKVKKIEVGVR